MASRTLSASERALTLYEALPYPNVPLSQTARNALPEMFKMSYTTAQYVRTHAVIEPEGKVLLNAGCGSGWETLMMAEANPGAKIVAFDLSPASVKLTEERLRYHGFTDTEFYVLNLLELDRLGIQFDFISLNDVLYLLEDPTDGLRAMKRVLKPEGIIRANLHHRYQRQVFFRMQEAFQMVGQFDVAPATGAKNVREFMGSLQEEVAKGVLWNPASYTEDPAILNNYLLSNDKGFTIPELFEMLRQAGLGFLSLVDMPDWSVESLFKEVPEFVRRKLEAMSPMERLQLYELIRPAHRLIDFWVDHAGSSLVFPWSDEDWLEGSVQFNPILLDSPRFHQEYTKALQENRPYEMQWTGATHGRITLPADKLKWLAPLLQGPTPVREVIQGVVELGSLEAEKAADEVLTYLTALEDFLFILLQPSL
ncbi:class I SAM-dependent methyltransferase [Thermostichus vulcanus]|uniref:Class I SAM-dependent methyltransferase n=1 Tax=Thermostichus vulcanus str. 'Rupite' TaxID=2813851 RepID=A0ABT0C983_THEVL|nr:class I SAM-dependent methyltransferase [Thermostichus vulcanus]MCJ2542342.1 class I SAM-dependent methyltransferase [Thermostichus vulcanus str. 'Rupite']